ncbi:MAG: ubiquinone/menaquinone biosynthesis methyltransferase, partial [Candidatus Latescibacterota bacterium]
KAGYNSPHSKHIEEPLIMSQVKAGFIQKVFSEVPETYELVNHVLTLGLDVGWRKRAARIAADAAAAGGAGGGRWIDVCTGTGETAAYLDRLAPNGTKVFALDFSQAMLAEAKKKNEARRIHFVSSDIKSLPFSDASFDLVMISFATRNINLSKDILVQSFVELHRVLAPGGRFINVETSQPSNSLIRKCFHLYIKLFVRSIGSRISGSKSAYTYLSNTIPRFYPPEELADIMRRAGFDRVTYQQRFQGVVAIHQGVK